MLEEETRQIQEIKDRIEREGYPWSGDVLKLLHLMGIIPAATQRVVVDIMSDSFVFIYVQAAPDSRTALELIEAFKGAPVRVVEEGGQSDSG